MIAPLRRVHRVTIAVMLIGLPILLARSLLSRPDEPRIRDLPAILGAHTADRSGLRASADPLVYRTSEPAEVGATLPKDAHLVGTLRSTPAEGRKSHASGRTYFAYSLAKQEILAVFGENGDVR